MDQRLEFYLSQLHVDNLYKDFLKASRYANLTMFITFLLFLLVLMICFNFFELGIIKTIQFATVPILLTIVYVVFVMKPANDVKEATQRLSKEAYEKHKKDFPN